MKESRSLQQRELHAYVDGQLNKEGQRRVEDYLESHPEALEQVRDYQLLNDKLRQHYAPVLEEPIPPHYLQPRQRRDWWRPLRSLAAAGFLLALGISIGLYLGTDLELADDTRLAETDHVVAEAAMAYAVYSPEVRHPVEVRGDQEEHLVSWLSKRMGQQIKAPKLDSFGMHLLGGRLLASEDGPGALLMYENAEGKRVILYACISAGQKATAFQFAQQKDISVFYWFDNSISYALAGEINRSELYSLAEAVYHQLIL